MHILHPTDPKRERREDPQLQYRTISSGTPDRNDSRDGILEQAVVQGLADSLCIFTSTVQRNSQSHIKTSMVSTPINAASPNSSYIFSNYLPETNYVVYRRYFPGYQRNVYKKTSYSFTKIFFNQDYKQFFLNQKTIQKRPKKKCCVKTTFKKKKSVNTA